MTHAYQEIYLNKAQSVLGDAFDYAINTCGIAGKDFIKLFFGEYRLWSLGKRRTDLYSGKKRDRNCFGNRFQKQ